MALTNIGEKIRNSKLKCVLLIDRIKTISISLCLNSEVNGEEKIAIKSALIGSFSEPVPQIAVQIAELIARIARYSIIQCNLLSKCFSWFKIYEIWIFAIASHLMTK